MLQCHRTASRNPSAVQFLAIGCQAWHYLGMTPDDILADHEPAVVKLAQELRVLLMDCVGEFAESAYPGWHGIGFRHPVAGYVCGIFPHAHHVRLLFEHGMHFDDAHGLLEGGESHTRHIDLQPGAIMPRGRDRGLSGAGSRPPRRLRLSLTLLEVPQHAGGRRRLPDAPSQLGRNPTPSGQRRSFLRLGEPQPGVCGIRRPRRAS